jgi:hypothetical protein
VNLSRAAHRLAASWRDVSEGYGLTQVPPELTMHGLSCIMCPPTTKNRVLWTAEPTTYDGTSKGLNRLIDSLRQKCYCKTHAHRMYDEPDEPSAPPAGFHGNHVGVGDRGYPAGLLTQTGRVVRLLGTRLELQLDAGGLKTIPIAGFVTLSSAMAEHDPSPELHKAHEAYRTHRGGPKHDETLGALKRAIDEHAAPELYSSAERAQIAAYHRQQSAGTNTQHGDLHRMLAEHYEKYQPKSVHDFLGSFAAGSPQLAQAQLLVQMVGYQVRSAYGTGGWPSVEAAVAFLDKHAHGDNMGYVLHAQTFKRMSELAKAARWDRATIMQQLGARR